MTESHRQMKLRELARELLDAAEGVTTEEVKKIRAAFEERARIETPEIAKLLKWIERNAE